MLIAILAYLLIATITMALYIRNGWWLCVNMPRFIGVFACEGLLWPVTLPRFIRMLWRRRKER